MPELCRLAAIAIGSKSCVQVVKVSEGQFNKVFLLTMDDGREVIAKLPNPNAGRPYFTTASEVATMIFVDEPPSELIDVYVLTLIAERLSSSPCSSNLRVEL